MSKSVERTFTKECSNWKDLEHYSNRLQIFENLLTIIKPQNAKVRNIQAYF